MQNNIITTQMNKPDSMQTSSTEPQQQRRRSSMWDAISGGIYRASEAHIKAIRSTDGSGFAPAGAVFDETFGGSALWETNLSRPKHDDAWKRERNRLAEDALRQMS